MNLKTLQKDLSLFYKKTLVYLVDVVQYLGVDLQVQLSHAWDYGFLALCVKMHPESGVLSGEAADAFGELVCVVLKGPEDTVDEWLRVAHFIFMYASVEYT